jgi:hypothetical protein
LLLSRKEYPLGATFANVLDKPYEVVGNRKYTVTDATMDGAYLTGGEVATAADLGLSYIDHAEAQLTVPANATDALGAAQFVRSRGITGLIKLYDPDVPADCSSADNTTGCIVRIKATGH